MNTRETDPLGVAMLYGPTAPWSGDCSCESCGKVIGREECYVFDIGGGVAYACLPCGRASLADGSAVLDSECTK